jgi:hypothetical protein
LGITQVSLSRIRSQINWFFYHLLNE